jgi:hypothetical protein
VLEGTKDFAVAGWAWNSPKTSGSAGHRLERARRARDLRADDAGSALLGRHGRRSGLRASLGDADGAGPRLCRARRSSAARPLGALSCAWARSRVVEMAQRTKGRQE